MQRCRAVAAGRGEADDVLLDGAHVVADAIEAGVRLEGVLVDDRHDRLAEAWQARGIAVLHASAAATEAASPVRSPSGIVAIARWAPAEAVTLLAQSHPRLVGLVGVQDPGNVGTIIRSADALGATGVLVLDDSAAPGGWKALRSAVGSTFRLPVGVGPAADVLAEARRRQVRTVASVATSGAAPDAGLLDVPLLVLVGNEGAGLPPDLVDACDQRVTLPMRARVNSLNVATSAAILLWEMTRPLRDRRPS